MNINDGREKTAKRLKELRLQHGYTMESLGEKLGVVKSTIAKWENGYVDNIKRDMLAKLSDLYNVSPLYIMGYDEPEQTTIARLTAYQLAFLDKYSKLTPEQRTLVDAMMSQMLKS